MPRIALTLDNTKQPLYVPLLYIYFVIHQTPRAAEYLDTGASSQTKDINLQVELSATLWWFFMPCLCILHGNNHQHHYDHTQCSVKTKQRGLYQKRPKATRANLNH